MAFIPRFFCLYANSNVYQIDQKKNIFIQPPARIWRLFGDSQLSGCYRDRRNSWIQQDLWSCLQCCQPASCPPDHLQLDNSFQTRSSLWRGWDHWSKHGWCSRFHWERDLDSGIWYRYYWILAGLLAKHLLDRYFLWFWRKVYNHILFLIICIHNFSPL